MAALPATALIPPRLRTVVDAVRRGEGAIAAVRAAIKSLGFDSFMAGISLSPRPDREASVYGFATLPREWMFRWDQQGYVEIDPRISLPLASGAVEMWDQARCRGKDPRVDSFLDDAARFGICSGVSFTLHDVSHHGALVVFNSTEPLIDETRRLVIELALPDIVSFGHSFLSWFSASILKNDPPPELYGVPLSPRELEVLRYVARGLNTEETAFRMKIVPRTVQLHLDSARSKLGAANRQEAVALAMKRGHINLPS